MQTEGLVNDICCSQSGGWKSEVRQPGGEVLVRTNFSLPSHGGKDRGALWSLLLLFLFSQQVFARPWTLAHQAPLSMGFPRQGY